MKHLSLMRKKLFTFFLAIAASIGSLFAESGTCGDNLTWNLTDGVLTISGTGKMTDFSYPDYGPWYSSRSSIKTVNIGDGVTSIGDDAFYNCSALTSVTIGNSVTSIGNYAFYECRSLTSVTIPNSVTSIGDGAFYNCSSLTSVTIPNSVTTIGEYAFSSCSGLTSITIPNSVTSIGDGAFYNCSSLTSVTIPNSVTTIGEYAFSSCSGLTSITIPNSVTSIGRYAFNNCSSLTSVTIPNSVTSIGDYTFSGCRSLTSVRIPNGVTSIGDWAFNNCTSLTSVTIPNSVTSIGSYAFSGCSSLTSVMIPNSVTSIGGSAFSGCSSLTSVTIPNSVTSIGDDTFYNCSSLTSVTIPNSVTSIGASAFYNCSSLTSITIPNSVTSIGNYAFSGCSGLVSVTIPNSVTSIGDRAFRYCSGLTSVTIPNSVTSIGDRAFRYCSSLTSVYISDVAAWCAISFASYEANPLYYAHNLYLNDTKLTNLVISDSITNIKEYAFYDANIKSVTLESTNPPYVQNLSFPKNIVVYVPLGTLATYKSTTWNNYTIHVINPAHATTTTAATSAKITLGNTDEAKHISSCGMDGGEEEFAGNVIEYIGLEPNSEYANIPLFIKTKEGDKDNTTVSFTTTALELTTKPSKPVSSTTAILLAETNMSDAEVSCGFEYKRNDAPEDMAGTKVFCPVASGQMAGRLKNLKDDVYYKYRAFYQSSAGNMYYGDWQYIFTGDVAVEFDPILYTYGATVVRENEATISGYALAGSEDFTEQGFEYWAETRANGGANAPHHMPAALNEHFFVQASGIALRATLTDLDAGTVYKYRVYGKVGDQYYYGSEQAFTTTGTYTPPTYTITFANWDGATLQSSQVEEGTLPEYTGATPERPEDEQYIYTFNGWSPAIVAATADATYTAQYVSKDKHEGLGEVPSDQVQSTKLLRNGVLYIERNGKTYTVTGAEVK